MYSAQDTYWECVQAGGSSWTLEEACREIEVLNAIASQVETVKAERDRALSEKESAVNERDAVYQNALQDMSSQLQVNTSTRTALQVEHVNLQRCGADSSDTTRLACSHCFLARSSIGPVRSV